MKINFEECTLVVITFQQDVITVSGGIDGKEDVFNDDLNDLPNPGGIDVYA